MKLSRLGAEIHRDDGTWAEIAQINLPAMVRASFAPVFCRDKPGMHIVAGG